MEVVMPIDGHGCRRIILCSTITCSYSTMRLYQHMAVFSHVLLSTSCKRCTVVIREIATF